MPEITAIPEAAMEVIGPDGARRVVRVTESPFLIGRGSETGNHVQLPDRRISRSCAAVVFDGAHFILEDRGQRSGIFIGAEKITRQELKEGDTITFGLADSYELVFRGGGEQSLPQLLTRLENISSSPDAGTGGLKSLNTLLAATALLHSNLPLDEVLGNMIDHAIEVTDADRGILLEPQPAGPMRIRLARQRGGRMLPIEGLTPSQTAIRFALDQKRGVITEDVAQADVDLQAAQSIIAQRLRSVVVIPLFASAHRKMGSESGETPMRGELLGGLYMDSRKPAAFSNLERQILDALAVEAASVMDNARLVARERERQRLEQELGIAREIQQALLPREFGQSRFLQMTGMNQACLTVGGDYFDVFPLTDDRTAFLIADVSGKGLGAALLTTMLQGALSGMSIGQEPAVVFAHINQFLCSHSQLERYATMFFAILDSKGRLEYINAGHPSPLLLRNDVAGAPFPAEFFPVGLIPDAPFRSASFQMEPGDTLILFSDGVSEAMNPDDEEFTVGRLRDSVSGKSTMPVEELKINILASVEGFTRGARQNDDLTLLLVRYPGDN
jgi:sigma-B regulation protein RsbU (phosphoserine phosphatase)